MEWILLSFFVGVSILSCGTFADDPEVAPCTSALCQEMGQEIITSIDDSVDACTDFYQHACGEWIRRNPVNYNITQTNQFKHLELQTTQNLKDLFDSVNLEAEEAMLTVINSHHSYEDSELWDHAAAVRGAIRKAKDYYKACTDLDTIDSLGLQPLLTILTANGDWPLTVPRSEWNPQHWTWQQINENLTKATEYPALFDLSVQSNLIDGKTHVITFGPITTSGDRLRETDLWQLDAERTNQFAEATDEQNVTQTAFQKYVMNTALAFTKARGLNVSAADVEADVADMLEFRIKLEEAYTTNSNDYIEYQIMTIKEAQAMWNSVITDDNLYKVDWLATIKQRFEGTDIVIDENEKLALQPLAYLPQLATLLLKTPVRTIVNYIHWYTIEQLLIHGDKVMRGILLSYLKEAQGATELPGRWDLCYAYHGMPHAVQYMYVKKHFPSQSRAAVIEMIDALREATKEGINNANWMNENERTLAKEKIDSLRYRIGYPDWYDVPGEMDNYYNDFIVGSNNLENVLASNRFHQKMSLQILRDPYVQANVGASMDVLQVNAEYLGLLKLLDFSAAILQMPIYNSEMPAALKFGGLGSIIGHEISHAFDRSGRLQYEDGALWSNSTIDAHNEKIQCIVNQYSQYEITRSSTTNKTIYVNGTKVLGEAVADNIGMSMSFKAFQRYKSLNPDQTCNIPALKDFSDEKLFFYKLANNFCEIVHPSSLESLYRSLSYPPKKVRINAALSNMQQFASTFGCSPGSKMNPSNKCSFFN